MPKLKVLRFLNAVAGMMAFPCFFANDEHECNESGGRNDQQNVASERPERQEARTERESGYECTEKYDDGYRAGYVELTRSTRHVGGLLGRGLGTEEHEQATREHKRPNHVAHPTPARDVHDKSAEYRPGQHADSHHGSAYAEVRSGLLGFEHIAYHRIAQYEDARTDETVEHRRYDDGHHGGSERSCEEDHGTDEQRNGEQRSLDCRVLRAEITPQGHDRDAYDARKRARERIVIQSPDLANSHRQKRR